MTIEDSDKILEQVARNLVAIEEISRVLGNIPGLDRKVYSLYFKELLKSNFELQDLIGWQTPENHPSFLGLEKFSILRKKYEDPENPRVLPTAEDIEKANRLWYRIQALSKK